MGQNEKKIKKVKYFLSIFFILLSLNLFAQTYNSLVVYTPTYESQVESTNTTILIKEDKKIITVYNATYQGEIANLRIDSIKTHFGTYELGEIKTFFCTDLDEDIKINVLDLIKPKNTIKLVYIWDEISIEEYSFIVKNES